MHKFILSLVSCIMFLVSSVFSQAPQKMSYQGAARNTNGNIIASQNIGIRITLHSGSSVGATVFQETHNVTTNQFGLFNLTIGAGTVVSGTFSSISWESNTYYVQVEMDAAGGTSYVNMGTEQLLSVPYALSTAETDPEVGTNATDYVSKWNGTSLVSSTIYNTAAFTGINTSTAVGSAQFIVGNTNGTYGGMYLNSMGSVGTRKPFYGYALSGAASVWTYLDEASSQWRVHNTSDALVVDANGLVGIGTTNPAYTLDVEGNLARAGSFVNTNTTSSSAGIYGSSNTTAGSGYGVDGSGGFAGVRGQATVSGSGNRYGVQGYGQSGASSNYGLFGTGTGGTTAYGVYGTALGATTNWAGYFASGNVYVQNNVGIGTNAPAYPLDAIGDGNYVGYFTNTDNNGTGVRGECSNTAGYGIGVTGDGGEIGVYGTANLSGGLSRKGVYGTAGGGSVANYGLYGHASSTNGSVNYGIYAEANGSGTLWGGYFSGSVYTTGTYQTSDRKLKNNIQPLNGALTIINKLTPSTYTFKTEEYNQMNLPEGLQYGLIADEVAMVMPGTVKKAVQPETYENNDPRTHKVIKDKVEFNAVNYTDMIPVLIGAVKEQHLIIEELKKEIEDLKSKVK